MSVINQVLSDLEKRGATALPGGAGIRATPTQPKQGLLLATVAVCVVSLVVAGLWWNREKIFSAPPPLSPPLPITAAPAPADAAPAENIISTSDNVDTETTSEHAVEPSMRLSFELSSIPLPSNNVSRLPPKEKTVAASTVVSKPVQSTDKPVQPSKPAAKLVTNPTSTAKAEAQIKQFSTQQLQENEFRRATSLVQQGRSNEAYTAYETLLQRDASYDAARQAMVAIHLDNKRNADAERLLQEGLQNNIKNSGFAMLLARLQVERGALPLALETLHKTLPYAERQADYQAFIAALLQRQNNHLEAINHYQTAVQLTPNSGVWLMGLGISLNALKRNEEARDAFRRALNTGSLSADLQGFVEQRLKELG